MGTSESFQTIFTHTNTSQFKKLTKVKRSGNPGYQTGKPLVFARRLEKVDKFEQDPRGFRVWGSNSPSSLCLENDLSEVYFGENLISSCYIRLKESHLRNCQHLMEDITELQKTLMRSRYVVRGGDYNFTEPPDNFVSIIYENVTVPELREDELTGCLVPATLRVTVLVVRVEYKGHLTDRINGVRVSPVYKHWTWKCQIDKLGSCREVQKFMLSTEVEFLEIPNIWHHENTTRFWLQQVGNNL